MRLVLNGSEREVGEATTVAELLDALGIPRATVVVERNGEVLSRERYPEVALGNGDRLEVVRFVGGG